MLIAFDVYTVKTKPSVHATTLQNNSKPLRIERIRWKKTSLRWTKHCDSCILELPKFILFLHSILHSWATLLLCEFRVSRTQCVSVCCTLSVYMMRWSIKPVQFSPSAVTFNVYAPSALPLRSDERCVYIFEWFWTVGCSTFWVGIRCVEWNFWCAPNIPYECRGID